MTISVQQSSIGVSNNRNKTNSPAFSGAPFIVKDEGKFFKRMTWVGDDFNSAQQRLVSGLTGVAIQPWFELNNNNVDQDTRHVSCARTLGKIVAGTLTGVLIRWGLIKAAEKFTVTEKTEEARVLKALGANKKNIKPARIASQIKAREQWLLPKEYIGKSAREITKYRNTFGTIAAVGVMLFTNFLVDAPLTTYLSNKFVKMITGENPEDIAAKQKGGK